MTAIRMLCLAVALVGPSTTGRASSAAEDLRITVSFTETDQQVSLEIENVGNRARGIYPSLDSRTMDLPQWLWMRIRKDGPTGTDYGCWNPIVMTSAARIDTPVRLQKIAPKSSLKIPFEASAFIPFMRRIEGFEEGTWVKFEVSFATDKMVKERIRASTVWLRYIDEKFLVANEQNETTNEKKAAEPGATDNPDDAQRLREDH